MSGKQRLFASVDADLVEAAEHAVAACESEHGEITQEEMDLAARRARGRTVVVREVARPARPPARLKRRAR